MNPAHYILNDQQCCCNCFQLDKKNIDYQVINPVIIQAVGSCCSCCSCLSIPEEESNTPIEYDSGQESITRKKRHAIDELLQTERDYVLDLNHLAQVCLQTLSRQPWILLDHQVIITRNILDILSFHKLFVISLHSVKHDSLLMAKKFLDQVAHFAFYKPYCDGHTEAWSLISIYRDRPEWAYFTKECSEEVKDSEQQRKLRFEDYLIKPVQRICRYQLLIKEIIRYTSSQTAEYDLWTAALNEMQDIVMEIDDLKFQRDMKERTEKFIERLDGDWRMSKQHASQLGPLRMAGAIEITYSALGQSVPKSRYLGCFIFSTYMIMVRPKKVTAYEPKHWFPLRLADLENLEDIEGQREHSFIVRCKKHTFIFGATCTQEKQLWIKQIQEAIEEAQKTPLEEFILSSLSGIATPTPSDLRLSRLSNDALDDPLVEEQTIDELIQRPVPAYMETNDGHPCGLVKRYSADYATRKKTELKPRNNSETYVKPDPFPGMPRRRPSSLDLLAENMFGKMSSQLKNNHQHALRLNVDHKLRDVCTQDYLSSRAWYMRNTYSPTESISSDSLKKKKSVAAIRHSVSSFSIVNRRLDLPRSDSDRINSQSPSTSESPVSQPSPEPSVHAQSAFGCTFNVSSPSITDSNSGSTLTIVKKKKKALAERVLKKITSMRQLRTSTPDRKASGDTLKYEIPEVT
ncbi:Dbl homology domain-containing protein [Sporodiniella umbellata]|nr:Dbl homology domain-containing protein [Sporodiniella umbellata]